MHDASSISIYTGTYGRGTHICTLHSCPKPSRCTVYRICCMVRALRSTAMPHVPVECRLQRMVGMLRVARCDAYCTRCAFLLSVFSSVRSCETGMLRM